MSQARRQLAAIMFTDVVGYTALGQRNESLSLALVEEQRKLIRPILKNHSGREVKTIGDGFFVELPSALDAIRCAYDIQRATREFNISQPEQRRLLLRIGIHLGDVVESDGDVSGDAVNVASRIEPLAEDGGVCLTSQVYDLVRNKFELQLTSLGLKQLKNVENPIEVFKMEMPWGESPNREIGPHPANRIAILPFASFSVDPNDSFFADGITEEIISTVAGISGLSVISRTSVTGYKGTAKKVEEIGRELKVGTILEGSFKKAGNRIRVTTQLIDVAGDKHLWAEIYDRNLDDVFAVQSDIARQVADALRVRILSPEKERIEKRPTESTAAYTSYLMGRYLWNKRRVDDLRKAAQYFEQAVRADPDFALGYVGLADCALVLRSNFYIDPDLNMEKAKVMVEKALKLDPRLAEAHTSKGLAFEAEYKLKQAEGEFKRAIELKPGYATAHHWYSLVLLSELRWDEAFEQLEKALELDPLSPVIHMNYGRFYMARRDYHKMLEPFRRAIDLGFGIGHAGLADAYGRMKLYDDMRREYSIAVEFLQDVFPLVRTDADAFCAYYEDDKQTLRRLLPEIEAHMKETGAIAWEIALAYFYLGERDKGFEWLERSYFNKEARLLDIKWALELDGVRDDPRYLDLLKRLELE